MGAVVAHGAVAGGWLGERVAVEVGVGYPGEVLADARAVGAAGVVVQRRRGELHDVAGVDGLHVDRQRDRCAATALRPEAGLRVI